MILAADIQTTRLGLALLDLDERPIYLATLPINRPGETWGDQIRGAVLRFLRECARPDRTLRGTDVPLEITRYVTEEVTYAPMSRRQLRDYGGVWHMTADAVGSICGRSGDSDFIEAWDPNTWKSRLFGTNRISKPDITNWVRDWAEGWGYPDANLLQEDSCDAAAIGIAHLRSRRPA
jgi:hypothetical protein